MPGSRDFDLESFQAKVLERVSILQRLESEVEPAYAQIPYPEMSKMRAENPGCLAWIPASLLWFQATTAQSLARGLKKDREELARRAEAVAGQRTVRLHLCPPLQGVSDDALEVARAITPTLASLIESRTVSMPLEANLFAMLSLVIARQGVANFCAEQG
ncbi:MAG TPA: hypothetical protein VD861_08030 [Pyrinomonadaceae bacterium]|nr:hypothetical protein [Pyrinomonadaceae bacterium]